jgi:uroporphyrinogen decarboxylase
MLSVAEELGFSALTSPNAYWEQAPGELAYYCLPGKARFQQMAVLKKLAPPDLLLIGISGGVIMADYSMDFCCALAEEPEQVDELAHRTLQEGLSNARHYRDAGADAVVTASDIADNKGPFFKREYMDRWILPYLQKWSYAVHEMGLHAILHSDGNLNLYLDDIANTEIDALQAIDPIAGMDLHETKQIVGNRLCLCGNIDCDLLLRGAPEAVFTATRDLLLTCKEAGGFVLGASNAVQPEVPLENYQALITAWEEYGSY